MQLSSEQLKRLKANIENLDNFLIDTDLDSETAIEKLIENETATSNKKTILNIKKIIQNPKLFEIEVERSINNNLIKEAKLLGLNHYESTTPCTRKIDGKSCGSYKRYISNRGCAKCQSTAKLCKSQKQNLIELIMNDKNSPSKGQKLIRLKEELNIKKSAAYRLIKLHEQEAALYKIPATANNEELNSGSEGEFEDYTIERINDYTFDYY